jgi:hypothetical protein
MYEDKPRRTERSRERPIKRFHPVYLILLIPYAAWVWVPFYNRIEPSLFGIPFFYWWQILGIFLTAACIYPVYLYQEGLKNGDSK